MTEVRQALPSSPVRSPAARVAMIGAGQLARMTHQAAVDLDVELVVLAGSPDEPAVLAGAPYRLGSHTDLSALIVAADAGQVVTFDHELVPPELLRELEGRGYVLRPGPSALAMAQDKLLARRFLAERGYPVPAWAPLHGPEDLAAFAEAHPWPLVLKARSGGYDGRGVLMVEGPDEVPPTLPWGTGGQPAWIVEEFLPMVGELAVLVARRPSGASVTYPVVATTQIDGICHWLVTPAPIAPSLALQAQGLAEAVAQEIGAVGICAVELFLLSGDQLVVNEVALRPHNSGHATIEANITSQFHQHLRAVLDWPLGASELIAPGAAMVNLIAPDGDLDVSRHLPSALAVDNAHIHLYGKTPRPGRKIGHVTALGPNVDTARDTAQRAALLLLGQ